MTETWLIGLAVILGLLLKISFDDVTKRTVRHRYLAILMVLFICFWTVKPNFEVLPYIGCILIVGFMLNFFGVLGGGDSKLLAVLSLGIMPNYIGLMLLCVVVLGGVMAILVLLYGLLTDFQRVREKGIPYAIPISVSGGFFIFLSYIDWFSVIS